MFYAAGGMNVPQAGADAEHLPSRASSSHPWLNFNFCFYETKIKEKGFRTADDILAE